jgi:hypothetical protein
MIVLSTGLGDFLLRVKALSEEILGAAYYMLTALPPERTGMSFESMDKGYWYGSQ